MPNGFNLLGICRGHSFQCCDIHLKCFTTFLTAYILKTSIVVHTGKIAVVHYIQVFYKILYLIIECMLLIVKLSLTEYYKIVIIIEVI